jgi:malonyl CoA-acyl carrier protein transacylase
LKAAEGGKENIKKYIESQNKNDLNMAARDQLDAQMVEQRRWDETLSLFKFQGLNIKVYESYEKYKSQ